MVFSFLYPKKARLLFWACRLELLQEVGWGRLGRTTAALNVGWLSFADFLPVGGEWASFHRGPQPFPVSSAMQELGVRGEMFP